MVQGSDDGVTVKREGTRFKLIVPGYNCAPWLDRCLASVESQHYGNYDLCFIDDASTSKDHYAIAERYCERRGWSFLVNERRGGPLFSRCAGIEKICDNDSDVIILLDGDDRLAHEHVLPTLDHLYSSQRVWMTCGNCRVEDTSGKQRSRALGYGPLFAKRLALFAKHRERIVREKLYRQIPWCFQAPHTFRLFLWRHIDRQHLLDASGHHYRSATDFAVLYPLLELADGRVEMIEEVLYVYNLHDGNLNVAPKSFLEQRRNCARLRKLKKYSPLLQEQPA